MIFRYVSEGEIERGQDKRRKETREKKKKDKIEENRRGSQKQNKKRQEKYRQKRKRKTQGEEIKRNDPFTIVSQLSPETSSPGQDAYGELRRFTSGRRLERPCSQTPYHGTCRPFNREILRCCNFGV